jgi:hypothetical protein
MLGVLSSILPIIIPIIITLDVKYLTDFIVIIIFSPILTYLIYVLINIIYSLFSKKDPFDNLLFIFALITLNRKQIYFSELGYFYIKQDNNIVKVYKQTAFVSKYLFDVSYNGNLEPLKNDIKSSLKKLYSNELKKKTLENNLKNWDGYIDTQSKRDDKLNQLL